MKNKNNLSILLVGVCVIGVAVFLLRTKSGKVSADGPVDVGNIYDWNLYDGPLAADFTAQISEPLMTKGSGDYYVSRIANRIEYKDGAGVIGLRENVFWSDGVRMTADHVFAALERRQKNSTLIGTKQGDLVTKAISNATFTNKSPTEIGFEGFKSEEEAYIVFTSLASGPIRSDLIEKEKSNAWKTTIGAYTPAELPDRFFPDTSIQLIPNQYYYQGKKPGPLSLKLHGVYLKAVKDAEEAKGAQSS